MFRENKQGQLVYWQNKKIRGFITPLENNRFAYSFGKPSQSMYYSFECPDLETAKEHFLSVVNTKLN